MITYYAFVSLFPLLLLLSTVLVGHPAVRDQVLHWALSQFPVIGWQLAEPKQLGGGVTGVVIVLGAL